MLSQAASPATQPAPSVPYRERRDTGHARLAGQTALSRMRTKTASSMVGISFFLLTFLVGLAMAEEKKGPGAGVNVIWTEPADIASRNLFYGSGGEQGQPRGTMTFIAEDSQGTNPKFEVSDQDGTKWKAKLGVEARPETVAAHLLWAAGFFADQDYFVASIQVEEMPVQLKRGQNLAGSGGRLENVRLERHVEGQKKVGQWHWKKNSFTGTREFNGLRVMMALMNNWDLKDQNTAIYEQSSDPARKIYVVSDLGASFGTTGYSWTHAMSKGNLKSYSHSRFISKVTPDHVDFNVPTRPAFIYFFSFPSFFTRIRMRWIGKHIPRADAKWMGDVLARLSPEQIRDAFRAGGYSPQEADGFAKTVEQRIAELNRL